MTLIDMDPKLLNVPDVCMDDFRAALARIKLSVKKIKIFRTTLNGRLNSEKTAENFNNLLNQQS